MKASLHISLAVLLGAVLTACGGGGSSSTTSTGTTTGSNAPTINAPDGARLLASQCFQCHGMDGVSASGIESIAGDSEAELVSEMLEMKYSTEIDIMHYQAKGYSEDQIRTLAVYIAALPVGANGGND